MGLPVPRVLVRARYQAYAGAGAGAGAVMVTRKSFHHSCGGGVIVGCALPGSAERHVHLSDLGEEGAVEKGEQLPKHVASKIDWIRWTWTLGLME